MTSISLCNHRVEPPTSSEEKRQLEVIELVSRDETRAGAAKHWPFFMPNASQSQTLCAGFLHHGLYHPIANNTKAFIDIPTYIYTLDQCGELDCFGKITTPIHLTSTQFKVAQQIAPNLGVADAQMFNMMDLRIRFQGGSGPFVMKSEIELTREDVTMLLHTNTLKHQRQCD